jgi:hypothetical protein
VKDVKVKKYPDRYKHIYLFESEEFEEGEFLLLMSYQTKLPHDAIVCSLGGSADLEERMPLTDFIKET